MTHGTYGGRCREEGARVRLYTRGDLSSAFSPILSCVPLTSPLYNKYIYILPISTNGIPLKIFDRVNSAWMCDITRRDWKFISNELDRLEQLVVEKNTIMINSYGRTNEWKVRIELFEIIWNESQVIFFFVFFVSQKGR